MVQLLMLGLVLVSAHGQLPAADAPLMKAATSTAAGSSSGSSNLQVIPKDTSQAQIFELMARYNLELGVACTFCHAQDAQTQQVDFASDENPMKQVARIMIGMVHDINHKYLSQVGDRRYAKPISCGNCHQGQTYPPGFDPARP
jgi:hypothetical protein